MLPYNLGFLIGEIIGFFIKLGNDLWNFATITVPEFINEILRWFAELPSKIWTFLLETISKITEFFVW